MPGNPVSSGQPQATGAPVAERLRRAGLRVTAPRLAVLEVLADHPHADADQITTAVRSQLGKVSTQAVYDVLAALTREQLIRRIVPAGHSSRYELRVGDNHHHMVCRRCALVWDVDCAAGTRPCLEPVGEHLPAGFSVDEAEVVYWGLCATCGELEPTG